LDTTDYKVFIKENKDKDKYKYKEAEVLRIHDFDYAQGRRLIVSHSSLSFSFLCTSGTKVVNLFCFISKLPRYAGHGLDVSICKQYP